MNAAESRQASASDVPEAAERGTVVFLGDRRFEYRERRGYAEAFRRLGWRVEWWPYENAAEFGRFVAASSNPIVVLPDDISAPVPANMTRLDIPTVTFQADTFAYPDVRMRRSMLFDIVCSPHPGWPERYRALGHAGAMLAAHAVDDAQFAPLRRTPIWDVGWVGRLDGELYESRRRFLPVLAARFDMNEWRTPTPMDQVGSVYASSKIVVNIPADLWWPDANLRAFEAMGAGALLITPVPSELEQLGLVEGRHFVGYTSFDSLPDLVERYLSDESARARIARSGRKQVLADHTYIRRVESILERALADDRPLAPGRRWSRGTVTQVILEQYVQERRWDALAGPARGLFRAAGWHLVPAALYLASRAASIERPPLWMIDVG